MIQRRRPIESAIAERKMFNMGGMAASMPQPTYMDLMQQGIMGMPQQPMGMPQQPQGIMASSQPLVDAIAADANNPAGGDTLSMAQGGLASEELMTQGFDKGGVLLIRPGSREERRMEMGRAPEAFSDATIGDYSIFDSQLQDALRLRQRSLDKLKPINRAFYGEVARGLGTASDYLTVTSEEKAENDRRREAESLKSVGFNSREELEAEQQRIEMIPLDVWLQQVGATGKTREYFLDPDNLGPALSDIRIGEPDEDEAAPESYEPRLPPSDFELNPTPEDIFQADADMDPNAPEQTPEDIFQADADMDQSGKEIVPAEGIPVAAADDSDVPRPKEKPPIPQGPFDVEDEIDPDAGLLVGTEAPASDAAAQVAEAPASDAAAQVAEAFDKPMTKPEATKTIQDYKNKFLEAMPEYQGVSEEEKGYRFIEAGLRVMAGQSSNAIENISNGLKGLGAEFAKDEKEKRAYDRQVDLSAAKYGLENLAKDEVKAAALAKEKRTLLQKVFVVRQGQDPFTYQGRLLKPGDRSIPNVGSIQDGTFPIDKFQTETSFIDALKAQRAKTKSGLELLSKQVIAPSKMESTSKQYIADTMRLRTNVATQSLLSRALVELQKPRAEGPLGVQATARRMLLGFANALGKKEYAESVFGDLSSQKDFDDFTNRAVTTQIEGLINEGGKITDQERKLAKEIGGALSQGARSGIFEDPDKLERQIAEFSQGLQRDSESRVRSINLAETRWDKHFRSMGDLERGYSYGDILKESRAPIGGQGKVAPISSRILPKTLNYRDIIIIGDDGEVKGFNPTWNIPK